MQIKQTVVCGRGINLKVASVNHDSERSMNREGNAIHQAMSNLNGMNGKRANLKALARPDFSQLSVIQQAVLIQFVFHISQSELGAPDGYIQLGKNPWQGTDV